MARPRSRRLRRVVARSGAQCRIAAERLTRESGSIRKGLRQGAGPRLQDGSRLLRFQFGLFTFGERSPVRLDVQFRDSAGIMLREVERQDVRANRLIRAHRDRKPSATRQSAANYRELNFNDVEASILLAFLTSVSPALDFERHQPESHLPKSLPA